MLKDIEKFRTFEKQQFLDITIRYFKAYSGLGIHLGEIRSPGPLVIDSLNINEVIRRAKICHKLVSIQPWLTNWSWGSPISRGPNTGRGELEHYYSIEVLR